MINATRQKVNPCIFTQMFTPQRCSYQANVYLWHP